MRFSLTVAALVGSALAQRPANVSMCDYYTTALLMNNTAANQYTLLTLLVNTAVIGNYTKPNVGIAVPGILTPSDHERGTRKLTHISTLLTHLYEYFGVLLGCSTVGSSGFPAYGGSSSQYQVHK
jgi:hypothetical protein